MEILAGYDRVGKASRGREKLADVGKVERPPSLEAPLEAPAKPRQAPPK